MSVSQCVRQVGKYLHLKINDNQLVNDYFADDYREATSSHCVLFGGGFEKGDPTRDLHSPDYFMMRDVVVVTVSYRVGPLGFLSLQDPAAGVPGNAGLKDQLLAMKWITRNAACFNADPANVTAFGESAGAASVHYLMLNPAAKGLFQRP